MKPTKYFHPMSIQCEARTITPSIIDGSYNSEKGVSIVLHGPPFNQLNYLKANPYYSCHII